MNGIVMNSLEEKVLAYILSAGETLSKNRIAAGASIEDMDVLDEILDSLLHQELISLYIEKSGTSGRIYKYGVSDERSQIRQTGQLAIPMGSQFAETSSKSTPRPKSKKAEAGSDAALQMKLLFSGNIVEKKEQTRRRHPQGRRETSFMATDTGFFLALDQLPSPVIIQGGGSTTRRKALAATLKKVAGRKPTKSRILFLSAVNGALESAIEEIRNFARTNSFVSGLIVKTPDHILQIKEGLFDAGLCTLQSLKQQFERMTDDERASFLRTFDFVIAADLHLAKPGEHALLKSILDFYCKFKQSAELLLLTEHMGSERELKEMFFGNLEVAFKFAPRTSEARLEISEGVWTDEEAATETAELLKKLISAGARPLISIPEAWALSKFRKAIEGRLGSADKQALLSVKKIDENSLAEIMRFHKGEYSAVIVPSATARQIEWPCDCEIIPGIPDSPMLTTWSLRGGSISNFYWIPNLSRPTDSYYYDNVERLLDLNCDLSFERNGSRSGNFRLELDGGGSFSVSPTTAAKSYFEGAVFSRGGKRYRAARVRLENKTITADAAPFFECKTKAFELVDVDTQEVLAEAQSELGKLSLCRIRIQDEITNYREYRTKTEVVCVEKNCEASKQRGKSCIECGGPLVWSAYEYAKNTKPTGPLNYDFEELGIKLVPPASVPEAVRWNYAHTLEHKLRLSAQFVLGISVKAQAGHTTPDGTIYLWNSEDSQSGYGKTIFRHFNLLVGCLESVDSYCSCVDDDGCGLCLQAPPCDIGHVGLSKSDTAVIYRITAKAEQTVQRPLPSITPPLSTDSAAAEFSHKRESLSGTIRSKYDVEDYSDEGLENQQEEDDEHTVYTGRVEEEEEEEDPLHRSESDDDNEVSEEPDDSLRWFEREELEVEDGDDIDVVERSVVAPYNQYSGENCSFEKPAYLKQQGRDDSERALDRVFHRYPKLPWEQQLQLFHRYERGDLDARDLLVVHNMKLVHRYARERNEAEFVDLMQVGAMGLMKAVERFDPGRGGRFSTYAIWWIRQCISRYISDCSYSIRLPVHVHEALFRLRKATRLLTAELGRQPTDEELSSELDISTAKLRDLKESLEKCRLASLDVPLKDEEKRTLLLDLLPDNESWGPEQDCVDQQLKEMVHELLNKLRPRERDIVNLRFGLLDGRSRTLEEVGQIFKVTRERVRQVESKALKKLANACRSKNCKDWLYFLDLDWKLEGPKLRDLGCGKEALRALYEPIAETDKETAEHSLASYCILYKLYKSKAAMPTSELLKRTKEMLSDFFRTFHQFSKSAQNFEALIDGALLGLESSHFVMEGDKKNKTDITQLGLKELDKLSRLMEEHYQCPQ